jgi:hypothetical protein
MARVNVEQDWVDDPRRKNLTRLFSKETHLSDYAEEIADGCAIALWRLAQNYVTSEGAFIPKNVFKQIQAHTKLIQANLVTVHEDSVFVEGSKKHLIWLYNRREAGAKGGLARSVNKPEKPNKIKKAKPSTPKQNEGNLSKSNPLTLTLTTGSYSNSKSSEGGTLGARIFESYARAYEKIHGHKPIRDRAANAICKKLGEKLGEEGIQIAAFYLTHKNHFYSLKVHPLKLFLSDAEGLRTQWKNNKQVTTVEARAGETKQQAFNAFGSLLKPEVKRD